MFSWKKFWLIVSPLSIIISLYLNFQIPRTDNFYIPTSQDMIYQNLMIGLLGIWILTTLLAAHRSITSLKSIITSKPITVWKYFSLFCFYFSILSTIAFSIYAAFFTFYGVFLIWLILSILLFVFWLVHRK